MCVCVCLYDVFPFNGGFYVFETSDFFPRHSRAIFYERIIARPAFASARGSLASAAKPRRLAKPSHPPRLSLIEPVSPVHSCGHCESVCLWLCYILSIIYSLRPLRRVCLRWLCAWVSDVVWGAARGADMASGVLGEEERSWGMRWLVRWRNVGRWWLFLRLGCPRLVYSFSVSRQRLKRQRCPGGGRMAWHGMEWKTWTGSARQLGWKTARSEILLWQIML